MSRTSFLRNKVLYSPLASQSMLRPLRGRGKRNTVATLLLTSLVDAFSILTIFLMMNSATDQSDFETGKSVTLPKATEAQATIKTALIRIENKRFMIDGKVVSNDNLYPQLKGLHERMKGDSLVVIADKDVDFMTLNPIIVTASRAGFAEFKFAVERIDQQK